ncbi:MAG: hypothetical protein H6752_12565 [Candidatus Omnitrophica bacterium]|nr:hypothetical protein [Candidatus Omnitrophota bacterium]
MNRRSDLQVAFVWENHYFFDLNDCIPEDRGWEKIRLVADINDQGQIVGVGKKDGRDKLFLLTPIEKANEPNAHP